MTHFVFPTNCSSALGREPLPVWCLRILWLRVLLVATLVPVGASAHGTGILEGRVFNAATNSALANARVSVTGLEREVLTDESGAYRITGVGAGEHTVNVAYLGMQSQTAVVTVAAETVVQRDFELRFPGAGRTSATDETTVVLEEFNVVTNSEMSAQAIAMNEQRNSANIKNVVAMDEYGDRGDENVGEFLRFLPGVALNDSGHVPNEVTLRGFPANTSGILLDGGEIAGARGTNTRSVSLLEVPMNNVSRVEVTKVPTPDMPASGLGGSINLISKSGFESRKPRFNYQVYSVFHNRTGLSYDGGPKNHAPGTSPRTAEPSFNLNYQHPVNKSLAFTVGASRTWRQKPMESGDDSDETATWDLVNGVQRVSQWQSLAQVLSTWTGQAGVDWRISPESSISASVQHRVSSSYITRSEFVATYGAGVTGDSTRSMGAATGVGSVSQGNGNNQDIDTETTHATLRFRHRGELWNIDALGSLSVAEAGYYDISRGHFNNTPASITNLVVRGDGIPATSGILPTRYSAATRTGAAVNVYDGGAYSLTSGTSDERDQSTDRLSGRFDLGREFRGRIPLTLKVGVSADRTERDQLRYLNTWNFRPNGATTVTARLAGNFDVFDTAYDATAPTLYGTPMRWISPVKVYELSRQQPSWFVLDEPAAHQNLVNNSRELSETISAAYVRADFRFLRNRLWIVTGLRFERTDVEGRGPLDDISAQYRKDVNGDFVLDSAGNRILITTDTLALRKLRYVERGARAERDYSGYYPSLNATFNLSENLIVRAAYARTIGRPNMNNIVPGATITDPDVTDPIITVSNTGLKPWTADSFDLTLESYHIKDGFGSIGLFQKKIADFFGATSADATPELLALYGLPTDDTFLNYTIRTQENVGDAKVSGVEFGYRQSLTFLPEWARGVQVFFNGTWMELSGPNTADFTGFNPSAIAAGVSIVRPRFAIKLTCAHQGETRRGIVAVSTANGIPADTYNYQAERTRWGINAQYSLSKRYVIYGSITDFDGGFNPLTRRYAPSTPEFARSQRYQELGYYSTIGIKGSF